MTQDSVLWRSRFRPWVSRSWQRLWLFWRDALGFDLAYSLGLLAPWFVFGHFERIAALPPVLVMIGGPAGIVTALIYRFRKRGGGHNLRHASALCFALIFVTFVTLHFVRYPAKRFQFMGDATAAFELEPMIPTYCERAYTFRGSYTQIMPNARAELSAAGYKLQLSENNLFADKSFEVSYLGSDWTVGDFVTVGPGRATGKHFEIDADMIDIGESDGWVTVTVAQPELLPFWLRLFVP